MRLPLAICLIVIFFISSSAFKIKVKTSQDATATSEEVAAPSIAPPSAAPESPRSSTSAPMIISQPANDMTVIDVNGDHDTRHDHSIHIDRSDVVDINDPSYIAGVQDALLVSNRWITNEIIDEADDESLINEYEADDLSDEVEDQIDDLYAHGDHDVGVDTDSHEYRAGVYDGIMDVSAWQWEQSVEHAIDTGILGNAQGSSFENAGTVNQQQISNDGQDGDIHD